jgi:hypothetical protein
VGFERYDCIFYGTLSLKTDPIVARKLNVPIYQLLGGKVRDKLRVYSWIGGDRPADVEEQG